MQCDHQKLLASFCCTVVVRLDHGPRVKNRWPLDATLRTTLLSASGPRYLEPTLSHRVTYCSQVSSASTLRETTCCAFALSPTSTKSLGYIDQGARPCLGGCLKRILFYCCTHTTTGTMLPCVVGRPHVSEPPLGPLGLLGCIELELPPACSGKTHAASAASSGQQYFLCQCSLERNTNAQPVKLLTLMPPLISTTTSTSVSPGPSWYGSAAAPSLLDLDLRLPLLLLVLYSKVS